MNTDVFSETRTVRGLPKTTFGGGHLERRRGQVCLRLGDVIEYVDGDRWLVTRSWQKPGAVPFDRMVYGEPINKGL